MKLPRRRPRLTAEAVRDLARAELAAERAAERERLARSARPNEPLTYGQVRLLHAKRYEKAMSKVELRRLVAERGRGVDGKPVTREEHMSQLHMDALLEAIAAWTPPPEAA